MPARHVTPRKPHVVSMPRGGHPVAGPIAFELDCLSPLVLLNDDQLGALAGVEGETIKYWRSRGLGPRFVQVNGRPKATVAAAKEWLAGLGDAAKPGTQRKKAPLAAANKPRPRQDGTVTPSSRRRRDVYALKN